MGVSWRRSGWKGEKRTNIEQYPGNQEKRNFKVNRIAKAHLGSLKVVNVNWAAQWNHPDSHPRESKIIGLGWSQGLGTI